MLGDFEGQRRARGALRGRVRGASVGGRGGDGRGRGASLFSRENKRARHEDPAANELAEIERELQALRERDQGARLGCRAADGCLHGARLFSRENKDAGAARTSRRPCSPRSGERCGPGTRCGSVPRASGSVDGERPDGRAGQRCARQKRCPSMIQ